MLLAPKPGSETRADLIAQSEDLRARAEELAAKVRDRMGPTVDAARGGSAVEGVRDRVGPAADSLRDRVEPVAGRVSSRVRRRGVSATESDGGPGPKATPGETGDSEGKEDA